MKMMWNLFVGIVIANVLFWGGCVGWMYAGGYTNQERIDNLVEAFSLTVDEEAALEADAALVAEEIQQILEQQARLESIGKGPTTLREQLDKAQQADETSLERIKFFNNQNQALRQEMARFKADHGRRVEQLAVDRKAFEQEVEDRAKQTRDADFQQTIELYETQAPKQTKMAFQVLMAQGQTDQVVAYLAAMSPRKAGKVLGQFKLPEEIPQAVILLERLRTRGEFKLNEKTPSVGNQS
ncbi:MAG: hypothetical protein JKY51_04975 [Opitutaceae bacterium]|nr:hypothetical protein [Opitutaceae bacterium]